MNLDFEEKVLLGVLVSLALFIIGLFVTIFFVSGFGFSNGTHTGYVTAVQESGIIWKTKRAYIKTSTESTQEDTYCVKDDAVYQTLIEKSKTGERVSVTYSHPLIEWNWNCGREKDIISGVLK